MEKQKVSDEVLKKVIEKAIPSFQTFVTSLDIADAIRKVCEADVNQIANVMDELGYELVEENGNLYWYLNDEIMERE